MIELISKGIKNPNKILHYVGSQIQSYYLKNLKYRKNFVRLMYPKSHFDEYPTTTQDGIYNSLFYELDIDPFQYRNFRTYLKVCDFAHYFGCDSILEIGAGYSTAIWAEYASRTGASVTSVDADFNLIEKFVSSSRHKKQIGEHIDLIKGSSIEPNDIRQFYSTSHAEIGGIEVSAFSQEIDQFTRTNYFDRTILRIISDQRWTVEDIVTSDNCIRFPSAFLNDYVEVKNMGEYISMIENIGNTGVLKNIIDSDSEWDLVWFDSGETSSIVEWDLFEKYINKGTLVAFHDIFFPKSMKNFTIAASLLNSDEWEVLLVDDSTLQGLLIARRIEPVN